MIQHYYLETIPYLSTEIESKIQASPMARFESGFDMSMSRENPTIAMYDFARFHVIDTDNFVDKETWEAMYARPDTEWYEGMTGYQAEAIRDEYDYNLKSQILNQTKGFNFANLGGYFAGALLDPLNYLPWTRYMSAGMRFLGTSAKALSKMGPGTRSIVDAVTGSVVGEGGIAARKFQHQADYDATSALLNVAMAGTIGAGVAGMGKVANLLKKNSLDENLGAGAKALDDASQGKPVEVHGTAPPKQKLDAEVEAEGPLETLTKTLDNEWKLLSEQETVKRVVQSFKNGGKNIVDFINCKMI
jgi:hypothetical protein